MIWLVWRQHRIEAALMAGLLALLGACLLAADQAIRSRAAQFGLGDCLAHYQTATCGVKVLEFNQSMIGLTLSGSVMGLKALPALAGVFLGAPLVAREVEQGTHRVAWTQSVTRSRWLASHLIAVMGIVLVASAVAQAAVNQVLFPVVDAQDLSRGLIGRGRFQPLMFDAIGILPVAYTLFAVALGTSCGALLRRTVGAMVLVLVLFVGVRVSVAFLARPNYMPAVTTTVAVEMPNEQFTGANVPPGSWLIDSSAAQGNGNLGRVLCVMSPSPGCLDHYQVTYQPADRFWPFQLIESGIFLALSLLLLHATWLLVRRQTA